MEQIQHAPRRPGRPVNPAKASAPNLAWRPRRSDADASGEDQFFIPQEVIPDGMDWQWKRMSVYGQEDIEHQAKMVRNGAWDSVPNEAWPDRLGQFGKAGTAITSGGMILMQRPKIYTKEAEAEQHRIATKVVSNQFESLGLTDGPLPKMKPEIKTDYRTQFVPADDEAE